MKLYKVSICFDLLVAAPTPGEAHRRALEAAPGEAGTLTRSRLSLSSCEAFAPGWQTLPDGWLYADPPIGSSEPISAWVPGTVDVG